MLTWNDELSIATRNRDCPDVQVLLLEIKRLRDVVLDITRLFNDVQFDDYEHYSTESNLTTDPDWIKLCDRIDEQ